MAVKTNGRSRVIKQLDEQAKQNAKDMESFCEQMAAPRAKSILELANDAVNGERQENYGDQHKNFTNIADIWSVILRDKLIEPLTPQEVAMCQIGLKLARLTKTGGAHKDSIIDVAGYAECLHKVNEQS